MIGFRVHKRSCAINNKLGNASFTFLIQYIDKGKKPCE